MAQRVPAAAAPASAALQTELERAFQSVLANPADREANLRYAKAAEDAGQPRKALAAYERMLLNDPRDDVARRGYERLKLNADPPFTRLRAGFGGLFETNASAANQQLSPSTISTRQLGGSDDFAGVGTLRIDDERFFGSQRWRSKAQFYGDFHVRSSKRDFQYGAVDSGPVFVVDQGVKVRPGLYADLGFSGYHQLFHSVGVAVDLDFQTGWVKTARVGFGRTNFRKSDNARDAWVYAGRMEMGWDGVFTRSDTVSLEPFVVFYDARINTGEETFTQTGATLAYTVPIAQRALGFRTIYLIPELSLDVRSYAGRPSGAIPTDRGHRSDWRALPGLKIAGSEFLDRSITAVVSYDFDRSRSNYRAYSYDNHRFGLNVIVEF
ncbi:MAG: hypothetical protein JNL07_07255 [Rhodospirillales bacterium]|nr:hypothetical protein [Rhodospirillales bacterium]